MQRRVYSYKRHAEGSVFGDCRDPSLNPRNRTWIVLGKARGVLGLRIAAADVVLSVAWISFRANP